MISHKALHKIHNGHIMNDDLVQTLWTTTEGFCSDAHSQWHSLFTRRPYGSGMPDAAYQPTGAYGLLCTYYSARSPMVESMRLLKVSIINR